MTKMRRIYVPDTLYKLEDVKTLADLTGWVNSITSQIPAEYWATTQVNIYSNDGAMGSMYVSYERPEIAQDLIDDENNESERVKMIESQERQTLEYLKRKYEK